MEINNVENEHVIGVAVLIGNAAEDLNRREGEGARIQNQAPTYYEDKELHRGHVGTGNSQESKEYRNKVNNYMLEGNVEGEISVFFSKPNPNHHIFSYWFRFVI
jgi:hypothetical protein